MNNFRDLIGRWGTVREFSKATGIKYDTAVSMFRRNSIKAEHFEGIVAAAKKAGFKNVTHQKLSKFAAEAVKDRAS